MEIIGKPQASENEPRSKKFAEAPSCRADDDVGLQIGRQRVYSVDLAVRCRTDGMRRPSRFPERIVDDCYLNKNGFRESCLLHLPDFTKIAT
jgi:hypothetical protein